MIVADTDVLIDYLQGVNPAADRISLEIERGQLATTAINRFELLAGAASPRQIKLIGDLLTVVPILVLDADAADMAAALLRELQKRGQTIGMGDSLIAGIVLARKAALLTRNLRHFGRVPDLPLVELPD
jgi:tRNA(fMet)-specific endonuclease VapC